LHVEKTQSRGRVDCVLETKDYVYIYLSLNWMVRLLKPCSR
jgi:Protein of unknown function (DUF1703).